jgi:ABC-type polysaccharide transport system permease subunit
MITAQTRSTGEILDVWIFNRGIMGRPPLFELATAVGGLTNVIGLVLIIIVNSIAKWFGEDGIF